LHGFANVQTALCINESSKIGIVHFRGYAGISDRFYVFFERMGNKIRLFFENFHGFQEGYSIFSKVRTSEFEENITFLTFLDKKRSNSWKKSIALLGKHKMIRWNSIFLTRLFDVYASFKMSLKPFDVVEMGRNDRKGVLKKWRSPDFSNVKAPISINITSCVSQPSLVHA
jgi:hypothetical protein